MTDNLSCLVVHFYLRIGTGKGAFKLHKNEFKNSPKSDDSALESLEL